MPEITPEVIQDLFYSSIGDTIEGWTLKSKELLDHTRWSVLHTLVLEKDGEYYQTIHEVAATEYQEVGEQDYRFTEVYPHKMVAVTYEKEPDEYAAKLPGGLTAFTFTLLLDKAQQGEATAEDAKLLAETIMKMMAYYGEL